MDGVYTVHEEVAGDELNAAAVQEGLQTAAAGLAVTPSGAQNATFELTSVDCYETPAITTATLRDTPDSLFRTALAELEVKVDFNKDSEFLPHGEETLTSHDLASILDLEADGTITIDEKVLAETISEWATKYNQYDAPFIFDSWVKGVIQIDFVTCNYLIDAQSVMEQIRAQLLTMESGEIDADAVCYDTDGKPFSLGDSYVEVDFDNQQMTYIKDGRLVVNTNIVTGALNGHQTPTGTGWSACCMKSPSRASTAPASTITGRWAPTRAKTSSPPARRPARTRSFCCSWRPSSRAWMNIRSCCAAPSPSRATTTVSARRRRPRP